MVGFCCSLRNKSLFEDSSVVGSHTLTKRKACPAWTGLDASLAFDNSTCTLRKQTGSTWSILTTNQTASRGVTASTASEQTVATVELVFASPTSPVRCTLRFADGGISIYENGQRVFPSCLVPVVAQEQYSIVVSANPPVCLFFRNTALLYQGSLSLPSQTFTASLSLGTVGSQASVVSISSVGAPSPSVSQCVSVQNRQPALGRSTCGPCLPGFVLNRSNTNMPCIYATASPRAAVAWSPVGTVFTGGAGSVLASGKGQQDPAGWGEGAIATAAIDLQFVGGVRWRMDAWSRDTLIGLSTPVRASLLCLQNSVVAVLVSNRTVSLLENGVPVSSVGLLLVGNETFALFANATTYAIELSVNSVVVARSSSVPLTWIGGPLILTVSFSNAPLLPQFTNAVTRGWAWIAQTSGRLSTAEPTTPITSTFTTLPTTTTPPPCCSVVMVFFLDYDRVFGEDPINAMPEFIKSIRNMLAYPRMFDPPITTQVTNVSVQAGALGQFADRTILVRLNFTDLVTMRRVSAALARLYFLKINYLGYDFYPMPLGASYTVPTVTSSFNADVWIFVLCSLGFFVLVGLYFRRNTRADQEAVVEDHSTPLCVCQWRIKGGRRERVCRGRVCRGLRVRIRVWFVHMFYALEFQSSLWWAAD
jgi:hypothetical protein